MVDCTGSLCCSSYHSVARHTLGMISKARSPALFQKPVNIYLPTFPVKCNQTGVGGQIEAQWVGKLWKQAHGMLAEQARIVSQCKKGSFAHSLLARAV